MLAATTSHLRTLSHGMHRPSEKCGRATKGRFSEIRDTLYSGIAGTRTAEHFASAERRFENWFSYLLCRWYSVCQARWTMLLRCYLWILGEPCSGSHARENPRDLFWREREVISDGTLECMSSQQTSKKDMSNEDSTSVACGIKWRHGSWQPCLDP